MTVFLEVALRWANSGGSFDEARLPAKVSLPFSCDKNGDLFLGRHGTITIDDQDNHFNFQVHFYSWKDNLLGWPLGSISAPPEIRVLHILIQAVITALPNSKGLYTVSVDNVQGAPALVKPQSGVLVLGPMIIELVQPVSKLQGVFYQVQFPIDKPDLTHTERTALDTFTKDTLKGVYEIRVTLESGAVTLRGEARASATYKGSPTQRSQYNLELSKKRKATVIARLKDQGVPNLESNLIKPVGDSKAPNSEENQFERRCDILIDGDELQWAVQQLWLANKYLGR